MHLQFATCERNRALGFLQKLYPSRNLTNIGKTKAVLDLVEQDIFRIPDPSMHGPSVGIFPSTNWDDTKRDEYIKALTDFRDE